MINSIKSQQFYMNFITFSYLKRKVIREETKGRFMLVIVQRVLSAHDSGKSM